jgi:hypothetical protein
MLCPKLPHVTTIQFYKGERGERGPTGPAGEDGAKGDTGEKGDKGDPGEPGADVGGGSGESTSILVTQVAHGFVVGQALCKSGSAWALADKDTGTTACAGLVSEVIDADNFQLLLFGKIELTTAQWDAITGDVGGLVPGEYYFLDGAAGALTKVTPTTGYRQVLLLADSSTMGLFSAGEVFSLEVDSSISDFRGSWLFG